eukprot:12059979-Ditylum_brightwellii.AAC.1
MAEKVLQWVVLMVLMLVVEGVGTEKYPQLLEAFCLFNIWVIFRQYSTRGMLCCSHHFICVTEQSPEIIARRVFFVVSTCDVSWRQSWRHNGVDMQPNDGTISCILVVISQWMIVL